MTLIGLPGLLGQYGPSNFGHASPAGIAHWALLNGALLPFGLGLAVIPGAIFGLGLMLARPRTPLERAIAVLTVVATTLFLGQTAMISASEAHSNLPTGLSRWCRVPITEGNCALASYLRPPNRRC